MLEYNSQYETHPLYNHFRNWVDMEESYTDTYFIINTSLYAAEQYIYNTYSISTRALQVHEYFGDVTEDVIHPRFNIHNLLSIYTNEGYVLPSIIYYDPTEATFVTSEGPMKLLDNRLEDVSATNLNLSYVTGYIYPTSVEETSIVPEGSTEDWGSTVTKPRLGNPDGSPLYSPLSTTNTYYDLFVVGDTSSTIYINDVEGELLDASGDAITEEVNPQPTITADRIGKVTLTLLDGINTFNITAKDASDNVSQTTTIVINKQAAFSDIRVELQGKDLVTNDGNYKLIVNSIPGSQVNINEVDVVLYSSGRDVITNTTVTEGLNTLNIKVTAPSGTVSRTLVTHILYDSALTDEYVAGVNDTSFSSMEMPQDMLMAILMIANHYFKVALYKNDETFSYGDNVSNRTTFNADRFPSDAHKILSSYVMY